MIRSLFARLTGDPRRGQALFDSAVGETRQAHWFVEGEVADTVEGRFAILASVAALMIVRLEGEGAEGKSASVALTERFVEALDIEIREMGVGEPALGKQVRRLVGALAGRVERWRSLVESEEPWTAEVERSLYGGEATSPDAAAHSEAALRELWRRLSGSSLAALVSGRIG